MPVQLTNQLERLSYTKKDLPLLDEEVGAFIKTFIPTIKNTGTANIGRLFLRVLEGLIDKLHYSQDAQFRQSVLRTVSELRAAQDITELVRYKPLSAVSATADLTVTTIGGPAGVGGLSISQYSTFSSNTSPVKQWLSLEAITIPEGASSYYPVPIIEGTRVVDQTIKASTDGDPGEEIRMPVAKTPHEYLEVKIDGTACTVVNDFRDSREEDLHCAYRVDEDLYTTVIFGDGVYGSKLAPGSVATATYIQSLGVDGNSPAGVIQTVNGALSSQVSVTNEEEASGGSDGDDVDDIVRKAPKYASSFARAVTDSDFEAIAETVSGVYQALTEPGDGPAVDLWIMPDGGGTASSTLLAAVEDAFEGKEIHGALVTANSLLPANILIQMDVALLNNKISRSEARNRIRDTITATKANGTINENGALYYRNLTIGRGFAFSDMSSLVEAIEPVDFVNYVIFTRYPTPIPGTPAPTVEFLGKIVPNSVVDYDEWSVQAATVGPPGTFRVYKNGVYDSSGTCGTQFTTSDGSLTFTLGETADALNLTDNWTFKSSAYRNNIRLDTYEFMNLGSSDDLRINIYYPGELVIGG